MQLLLKNRLGIEIRENQCSGVDLGTAAVRTLRKCQLNDFIECKHRTGLFFHGRKLCERNFKFVQAVSDNRYACKDVPRLSLEDSYWISRTAMRKHGKKSIYSYNPLFIVCDCEISPFWENKHYFGTWRRRREEINQFIPLSLDKAVHLIRYEYIFKIYVNTKSQDSDSYAD